MNAVVSSTEFRKTLRGALLACRDEAMRIRLASRAAVEENRRQRRAMGQQTRDELRNQREDMRRAVAGLRCRATSASKAISAPAVRLLTAGESEQSVAAQPVIFGVWNLTGPETASSVAPRVCEGDVLGAINIHPEGVAMADIGNELGVDWRAVVGCVRRLLNDGDIEQIEQLFYPLAN